MTLRFHLTVVKMVTIQKANSNKYWRGFGKKESFTHCWWEYKLVYMEISMAALKTLKIDLSYDPTMLLLGIYVKECK
jgi:hypothetical protein